MLKDILNRGTVTISVSSLSIMSESISHTPRHTILPRHCPTLCSSLFLSTPSISDAPASCCFLFQSDGDFFLIILFSDTI